MLETKRGGRTSAALWCAIPAGSQRGRGVLHWFAALPARPATLAAGASMPRLPYSSTVLRSPNQPPVPFVPCSNFNPPGMFMPCCIIHRSRSVELFANGVLGLRTTCSTAPCSTAAPCATAAARCGVIGSSHSAEPRTAHVLRESAKRSAAARDPLWGCMTRRRCPMPQPPAQRSPIRMELPPTCTNPAQQGTPSSPPSA